MGGGRDYVVVEKVQYVGNQKKSTDVCSYYDCRVVFEMDRNYMIFLIMNLKFTILCGVYHVYIVAITGGREKDNMIKYFENYLNV